MVKTRALNGLNKGKCWAECCIKCFQRKICFRPGLLARIQGINWPPLWAIQIESVMIDITDLTRSKSRWRKLHVYIEAAMILQRTSDDSGAGRKWNLDRFNLLAHLDKLRDCIVSSRLRNFWATKQKEWKWASQSLQTILHAARKGNLKILKNLGVIFIYNFHWKTRTKGLAEKCLR